MCCSLSEGKYQFIFADRIVTSSNFRISKKDPFQTFILAYDVYLIQR